jgi:hypothetical protein
MAALRSTSLAPCSGLASSSLMSDMDITKRLTAGVEQLLHSVDLSKGHVAMKSFASKENGVLLPERHHTFVCICSA